jgi:hypothetical protein
VGDYRPDPSLAGNRVYYSGLSTSGTVKFEKVVGDSVSFGYNIEKKNNNYFIMAKHIDTIYISTSIYNLIVDSDGNLLSEYRFLVWHGSGPAYTLVEGIINNNDVYCFGYRGIANGSYLHRSDIHGIEYWLINLGSSSTIAQSSVSTPEGDILVGGYDQSTFLYKISPGGIIIWKRIFNTNAYCQNLINTIDGGIVLLADTFLGQNEAYLIKMNSDGITYDNY